MKLLIMFTFEIKRSAVLPLKQCHRYKAKIKENKVLNDLNIHMLNP